MSDYTAEQLCDMLSTLEGENRLDSSSIKNLPTPRTDAEIQALIDISIPTDSHILDLVRSQLILDDTISTSSLWSSEKIGQHVYSTPALYKKPFFQSFSIDVDNEVTPSTNIGGNRQATFLAAHHCNISSAALYCNSELVTGHIVCDQCYHISFMFNLPDIYLSAGHSLVYTLKGLNSIGQEFSINYEIKAV